MYDGKVCEWVISDITWEEWSFVNLPSDEYAGVTNYSTKENLNLFTNQESHIFAAESIKGTFFLKVQMIIIMTTKEESQWMSLKKS